MFSFSWSEFINTYFEQTSRKKYQWKVKIYLLISIIMSGQKIRGIVKKALDEVCQNWDQKTFDPYLINLELKLNLSDFIAELYANQEELQIRKNDIGKLLNKMGKATEVKNIFGREFFTIWLQFEIVRLGKLKERIGDKDLDGFPKEEKDQLEFLKKKFPTYAASNLDGTQAEILKGIRQLPLYKEFMIFMANEKGPAKLPSKLVRQSRIMEGKSVIKQSDGFSCALNLIKKMVERIGVIQKIVDPHESIQNLKEFIDEELERNSIESDMLRGQFKAVIFHTLHIEVKNNTCVIYAKTADAFKQSFINFHDFYECMAKVVDVIKGKIKIEELLAFVGKKVMTYPAVWYWPAMNGEALIIFLRNRCLNDPKIGRQLIRLLNSCPPNLKGELFLKMKKQFLEQVLNEIPPLSEKGKFLRCLLQLAENQTMDLEDLLQTGRNYIEMFEECGMAVDHLTKSKSIIEQNGNNLYIFDLKTVEKTYIYLTKEDKSELINKIENPFEYKQGILNSAYYTMVYTISRKQIYANYVATAYNTRCGSIKCEGPIFYEKFMQFGKKIKEFGWQIVTKLGKIIELAPSESQKIGAELYKLAANKDKNPNFTCKIGHEQQIIEVNAETLGVKELNQISKNNTSQVKQWLGFLIFTPAYKGQKGKEMEQIFDEPSDEDLNDGLQFNLKVGKKQYLVSERQSEESEEEQIIDSSTQFKYLGAFEEQFSINAGFKVDAHQNIHASSNNARQYFKRFQSVEIYELINKYLVERISVKKQMEVSNTFRLIRKANQLLQTKIQKYHKQFNKEFMVRVDTSNQIIMVENMANKIQANQFFRAFFHYCDLQAEDFKSKKSFVLRVNNFQKQYLQKSNLPGIKIVDRTGNKVEIQCSKKDKKKLEKELEALDEVSEFVYLNPDILDNIKKTYKQWLDQIDMKEVQTTEQTFKVAYKLRHHQQFKQIYLRACQMQAEKPTQMVQKEIKDQGQYLHIFRSEMNSVDKEISVTKMGPDILLEYKKKDQHHIVNALNRIKDNIHKELFHIGKMSGKEYKIEGINHMILNKLSNKIEEILKQNTQKKAIEAHIKVEPQSETKFVLKGIQMTPQQEKILENIMKTFSKSFQSFKKSKFKICDTQLLFNKTFSKFPKNQFYKKKIADLNHQFKIVLKSMLTQAISKVTQESQKQLEGQFSAYIQKSKLDAVFESKIEETTVKQLQKTMENIRIFEAFLFFKMDEFQTNSQVKNPAVKGIVFDETKEMIEDLESRYKASKIQPQNMKRYFKSLNILLTIYYGPQLPITKYLQDFRKVLTENNVVMVKVGTGSGKSTVIPPYLVGLGYKKVVVTQPRRLPCRQIYKRICSVFGEGVSGYQVGDGKSDVKNSLIYMTDGLLKMRAIFTEKVFDKIDVLVIDEIHERSMNIDILLLLLNDYYNKNQGRKLKIILCSATIDKKIGGLMEDAKLKVGVFEPQIPERYKVIQKPINDGTIIDKIVQLSHQLKNNEQMLVFFPGVNQVLKNIKILKNKYNKIAYPITAGQKPKNQEEDLKTGQIFLSTAISETSLTFQNLKIVIDSRRSRWRTFDPELELMKTEEDYSSQSSIRQRKGRVGRTCDGTYYHYEYQDFDFSRNKEHNPTELQKNDFTNVIFELLLRDDNHFKSVVSLLQKLKHDPSDFNRKIEYSKDILEGSGILKSNGTLYPSAKKYLDFGNMGNPQHNMALFDAQNSGCLLNMAYLVSFLMYGSMVVGQIVSYCKTQFKGGDLKVVHDFLLDIGSKIDLVNIREVKHIFDQMKAKCSKSLQQNSWFNILIKIMKQTKILLASNNNNVPAPASRWDDILTIFMASYKNKIFFNQSLFGGNKKNFQKIRNRYEFNYEQKKNDSEYSFVFDQSSALFNKDDPPLAIISLSCSINPLGECQLSLCQEISLQKINTQVNITLSGSKCSPDYFDGTKPLNEEEAFDAITAQIKANTKKINVVNNFPSMKLCGNFNQMVSAFKTIIEPKRRNEELKIDLKKILQKKIQAYQGMLKRDNMLPVIEPQHSRMLLQKLNQADYDQMFSNIRYQMRNDFGVEFKSEWKQSKIKVEKAKNIHLTSILTKLQNCFKWFSQCQVLSREQYKTKPQYIGDLNRVDNKVREEIMSRINNIVDSKIDFYILKGWVSGKGPNTQQTRTARMVAVCWILTNMFNCVIKGGFVRDWVVNGDEKVPTAVKQRIQMLKKNVRNRFKEVDDDTVVPSDIDAEMTHGSAFDPERFTNEMKKLGIKVVIEDDGWRKHIIFDDRTESGGFSADLIEPYTTMTHYTYDFDVNVMFIKKNYLNSIGMKIPLVYQNQLTNIKKTVEIGELINLCRQKKMTTLKDFIFPYRFKKFQARKWKIIKEIVQPICYKSLFTQSFPRSPEDIITISPIFHQKIVVERKCKILRIEHFKNGAWDNAFEAAQHWVISERERSARVEKPNNPGFHLINSNNKVLFHGTKCQQFAKNIKLQGFDSRCFKAGGMYGRGAYFAEDPAKSHDYTGPGPIRHMFICNVALGKQEELTAANNTKLGPLQGYHSIYGTAGRAREYIIDRWGQAKPLFLIIYQ